MAGTGHRTARSSIGTVAVVVGLVVLLTATLSGPTPGRASAPAGSGNAPLRTMASSAPPGLALSAVCWSPYDKEYVAFGGYNSTSADSSGTTPFYRNWSYTYQAGTWTNITSSSGIAMPNGGPGDTCFYDPPSLSILFLVQPFVTTSGLSQSQTNTLYTYAFQGGNWTNLSATAGALPPEGDCWGGLPEPGASAWDPVDGYGFYYVPCPIVSGSMSKVPEDWTYSGGTWTDITSSVGGTDPTEIAGLAWDNQTQKVVLVSGWSTSTSTTATQDYWMYSNASWSRGSFANMPASGFSFSPYVGFNPTDDYLIVAGGIGGPGTQEPTGANNYENVYKLDGTVWTNITSSSSAPSSRAWTSSGTANNTADLMFGRCPQALTNCEPYYSVGTGQTQFFYGGSWSTAPAATCAGNDCTGLPQAPTGLTSPTQTRTSMTLQWADPGYWLSNYTVYAVAGASCSGPMAATGTHGDQTTATVRGLAADTQYAFDVRGWNGTGQSPPSTCLVRTTGDLPGAPTNLQATAVNLTSLTLTWTNPGGGGLVNDTVYWAVGSSCKGAMAAHSLGGVAIAYAVTGLTPGTSYAFAVTAWNATGQSPPSPCVLVRTPQTPGAPTGLRIAGRTETSFSLTWTNPPGGGLVNDTVYYGVGSSCSGARQALGTSGAVNGTKVTGLTTGTEYAIDVTAWNVTQSPPSGCLVATTAQVPAAPTNLTVRGFTTHTILLYWTVAGQGLVNVTLDRYNGSACVGVPLTESVPLPTGSGLYGKNVTGLSEGVGYAFEVTVWNATGESLPSNCVAQTTAQPPGAPTGLAVSSVTDASIRLTWTNPGGGGLRSDTLYYLAGATCSGTMTADPLGAVQGSGNLTGLSSGTEYALAVTAWNATGQSPRSNCVTATTSSAPVSSSTSPAGNETLGIVAVAAASVVLVLLAVFLLLRRGKGGSAAPPPDPSEVPDQGPPGADEASPVDEPAG